MSKDGSAIDNQKDKITDIFIFKEISLLIKSPIFEFIIREVSRFEQRKKNTRDRIKNGIAGRTGKIAPITPRKKKRVPSEMYIIALMFAFRNPIKTLHQRETIFQNAEKEYLMNLNTAFIM